MAISAEIAKEISADLDNLTGTVTVSEGGPLIEKEQYLVWFREMSGRSKARV